MKLDLSGLLPTFGFKMESLHIKRTATSLEVFLDAQTGKFSFSGRSVSEHSVEFFKPILDWLQKYAEVPFASTEVVFQFEYFNSAARKSLVEIFNILNAIQKKGNQVSIVWQYDE